MRPTTLHPTEKQFQAQVVQFAKLNGWMVFHPLRMKGSEAGWPDLTLVKFDERGEGKLIFAELKTLRGKLSEDQRRWIHALKSAGARCFVWRPTDESWASIREALA